MSAGAFRATFIILLAGLLVLPCRPAFAQEDPAIEAAAEAEAPPPVVLDAHALAEQAIVFGEPGDGAAMPMPAVTTFSVFRMVLTLALVAAAIYGIVFFLKKAGRGRGVSSDPFLRVLATAAVGTNRGVHVVSLGSQAWLVGSAEHGVNLIGEITDKETLDAMILEDSRRSEGLSAGRLDFKSVLRKFGVPSDSSGAPKPEDIRKRSERLKGI